jgi:hypothetical protein
MYIILEQISYEWEEIRKIRSGAVAVKHFIVTVTMRCDWMRRTKNDGKPFQCYGMS